MKTLFVLIIFSFSTLLGVDNLRNPFIFSGKKEIKLELSKNDNINLIAATKIGNKFGAILEGGGKKKTVFIDDVFDGYIVSKIFINCVVLLKDKKETKLFIT